MRLLGVWILSPHTKKGTSLSPKKLLPLPWDIESNWQEENKDILEQCNKIIDKLNNGQPN